MTARGLPGDVVTFLMTDVEGSSPLWAAQPDRMSATVTQLDELVAGIVDGCGGTLLKARGEGDSHFAVFARPSGAVLAACDLQIALSESTFEVELRVRAAVHTGEIDAIDGDYYGVTVNQGARLRSLAHGGQTVLSQLTARLVEGPLAEKVRLKNLGHYRIRDFAALQEVFQADRLGASDEFPPLRTGSNRGPALMALVAFDVCGASRVAAAGGREVTDMHRTWVSEMRYVAEAHGAIGLKLVGDGCLAAFEDPMIGVSFVRALQTYFREHGLDARAGMDAGRIEVFDGEIVGLTPYVAAQICKAAIAGQIVVTGTLRDLLGGAFEVTPLGPTTLPRSGVEMELFLV